MNPDDVVMCYKDAAAFLGVSPRTLERWVQAREVPFVRYPQHGEWGAVRFLRSQLLRWREQRTVKPWKANNGEGRGVLP